MKVLFSCIGDTDPIRDYRDGSMLHIVRNYKPDKVYLFLSKDMEQKEKERHLYSTAIHHVQPECSIHFIYSGLVDVHLIDYLSPLSEAFYKIAEEYPDSTILLNLSSGTPQMKTVMSFLAIDNELAVGVQVDSPSRASNRHEAPAADDISVEDLIEMNEDETEAFYNRCHEPEMKQIRLYQVKKEIIGLIQAYGYKEALQVYMANKHILAPILRPLLEHVYYRSLFAYDKAIEVLKSVPTEQLPAMCRDWCREYSELEKSKPDKQRRERIKALMLHEYLMLAEIRLKRGLLQDFYIKLTPFLFELLLFYVEYKTEIQIEDFCTKKKKAKKYVRRADGSGVLFSNLQESSASYIIDNNKLQHIYPATLEALKKIWGKVRPNTDVSYQILLILVKTEGAVSNDICQQLEFLRKAEKKIRNDIAHRIDAIFEDDIKVLLAGKTSYDVYKVTQDVFFELIDNPKLTRKLVYNTINEYIEELLK